MAHVACNLLCQEICLLCMYKVHFYMRSDISWRKVKGNFYPVIDNEGLQGRRGIIVFPLSSALDMRLGIVVIDRFVSSIQNSSFGVAVHKHRIWVYFRPVSNHSLLQCCQSDSETHPVSYLMDKAFSVPEVKQPGPEIVHLPSCSADVNDARMSTSTPSFCDFCLSTRTVHVVVQWQPSCCMRVLIYRL
jgi:hypothetical protein